MIALFREKSSGSVFWLLLLSLVLHSSFFAHPPQVVAANGNGALGGLFFLAPPLPPFALILLYHMLVLLQALRLNHIASEIRLFNKPSYVIAMVYLLLTALFEPWTQITPALVCNTLLIWLFGKMVRLQEASLPRGVIFNIGLIAGFSVMLYHPAVTLVLLCIVALAVLRPFYLNEWFIMLLGLLTPFYLLVSLLYLGDSLEDIWLYVPEWALSAPNTQQGALAIGTGVLLAAILLAGIYLWRAHAARTLIQVRKAWSLLLFMLLVLLPVMFICKDAGFESGLMAMVPAAVFAAGIFIYPRRLWLPSLLFWALAAVSLYNTWLQ